MDDIWKSVFAPNIKGDPGANISYWVLYVPDYEADNVWEQICQLTLEDRIGNRVAVSPDVMQYGDYPDHYTIIIDTPVQRKDLVSTVLDEHGLEHLMIEWKTRTKFSHHLGYNEH